MPKPLVYLETTIFSFYHDERESHEVKSMRAWTRDWWDNYRSGYDLVTSVAVLAELSRGSLPHRHSAQAMAAALPALPFTPEASHIVAAYIAAKVMPADPLGDALHLALASLRCCDYLLTWNCQHIANASKFDHIHSVNSRLGIFVPKLITPLELIGSVAP